MAKTEFTLVKRIPHTLGGGLGRRFYFLGFLFFIPAFSLSLSFCMAQDVLLITHTHTHTHTAQSAIIEEPARPFWWGEEERGGGGRGGRCAFAFGMAINLLQKKACLFFLFSFFPHMFQSGGAQGNFGLTKGSSQIEPGTGINVLPVHHKPLLARNKIQSVQSGRQVWWRNFSTNRKASFLAPQGDS